MNKSVDDLLNVKFNGVLDVKFNNLLVVKFEDLDQMRVVTNSIDVENAIQMYSLFLEETVYVLMSDEYAHLGAPNKVLDKIFDKIDKAWSVPNIKLRYKLCKKLRNSGGLDLLINNCASEDQILQFSSVQLLEKCLTTENRIYVLEYGVQKVVHAVCKYMTQFNSVEKSNVSTGILENLFKHSKIMCSDMIKLGALNVLIYEYRNRDVSTLKHWASALANLSLYGGPGRQYVMLKRNVPAWLLTLALKTDVNIKYYAFLAIAVFVASKETESAVIQSESVDLNDSLDTIGATKKLAWSNAMAPHSRGQCKEWLERLIPVLSSDRQEACNLAAFHFCMEAGIRKQHGTISMFKAIGVIEPLKIVTNSSNAVASRFAAKALRLIDDDVPYKFSKNVHQWSVDEVHKWADHGGFQNIANKLSENLVDGDILMQLTEDHLRDDIEIDETTGKRFMRQLCYLKQLAVNSSKDSADLHSFLKSIGPEYTMYTYPMLNAGVNMKTIRYLTKELLKDHCGISNSIHRDFILNTIKETYDNVDVFISYRRSSGSNLASLLKCYLEIQGYQVFIDVIHLENGIFGDNLLKNVKKAKNFVLVLTESSLDRCVGDHECKDWVHKEIVTAIENQHNIIPVVEDFTWPEKLPDDMDKLRTYGVVRWSHDNQDASVAAIETAMHRQQVVEESSEGCSEVPNTAKPPSGHHIFPSPAT